MLGAELWLVAKKIKHLHYSRTASECGVKKVLPISSNEGGMSAFVSQGRKQIGEQEDWEIGNLLFVAGQCRIGMLPRFDGLLANSTCQARNNSNLL